MTRPADAPLLEVVARLDEKLTERLNAQDNTLSRIETQVNKTNGRVTVIESERAAERAVALDRTQVATAARDRQVRREDYRRVHLPSVVIGALGLAFGVLEVLIRHH